MTLSMKILSNTILSQAFKLEEPLPHLRIDGKLPSM